MGWLLDTNVLSELRKGDKTHPGVRAWFHEVLVTRNTRDFARSGVRLMDPFRYDNFT